MAIQSQPSRISEPFAGSGTKNVIPATNVAPSASQAASWASGFPPECSQPISAGGCPVPRNDVNGVLNQLSQDYSFRQDGGIWEWSALADYDIQRMVRGSDGLLYYSKAQSGPSIAAGAQDPTLDTAHTYWDHVPTDDASVVHKTGAETISSTKTFTRSQNINFADVVIGSVPTETRSRSILFNDSEGTGFASVTCYALDTGATQMTVAVDQNSTGIQAHSSLWVQVESTGFTRAGVGVAQFRPTLESFATLGTSGDGRWGQIYSTSSTISTSDERKKESIGEIPDDVLDAWGDCGFVQYQMRDAVAKKGAEARLHSGMIAQRIGEAFKTHGLNAAQYGLFCHDEWDASPANGNDPAVEAGDEYSLRYEEALCMEAAYQRRRADRAEARLAALEERLAAIEAKLG